MTESNNNSSSNNNNNNKNNVKDVQLDVQLNTPLKVKLLTAAEPCIANPPQGTLYVFRTCFTKDVVT